MSAVAVPYGNDFFIGKYLQSQQSYNVERVFLKEATKSTSTEPIKEIKDIISECFVENWDGYNSKPIDLGSVNLAVKFWYLLKENFISIATPDFVPEPNGMLGMEWNFGKNFLVISIEKNGKAHYASRIGDVEKFGTFSFSNNIPNDLKNFFTELYD